MKFRRNVNGGIGFIVDGRFEKTFEDQIHWWR